MATDKLGLYNGALRLLGESRLASLAENRAPRRHLDQAWTGAVRYCLEAGQWKFAMRSRAMDYSPSVTPGFGFTYGVDVPDDQCRLAGFYSDEAMSQPLTDYREEAGFWYFNLATVYVSYVSDDASFGGDFSLWPQRFVKYVEAHLAFEAAEAITGDEKKRDKMLSLRDRVLLPEALSHDAMQGPSKALPAGNWVRARFGGYGSREQGRR